MTRRVVTARVLDTENYIGIIFKAYTYIRMCTFIYNQTFIYAHNELGK